MMLQVLENLAAQVRLHFSPKLDILEKILYFNLSFEERANIDMP